MFYIKINYRLTRIFTDFLIFHGHATHRDIKFSKNMSVARGSGLATRKEKMLSPYMARMCAIRAKKDLTTEHTETTEKR